MLLQHLLEVSARMTGWMLCHRFREALQVLLETSLLMRFAENCSFRGCKMLSQRKIQFPFAFDLRLNQIPDDWQQIAVRFRRVNGIRDGNSVRSIW